MGKLIVVLCCTLFLCGLIAHFLPGTEASAFDNHKGVTWMMLIGCVTFVGSWKLLGK